MQILSLHIWDIECDTKPTKQNKQNENVFKIYLN